MFKNKVAVNAYHRVLAQRTEGWEEGEACDAGFDAGEWSGAIWGDHWEQAEKEALAIVASAFGITSDELYDSIQRLDYMYEEKLYKATTPWEPYTDATGVRQHGRVCHEHRERGLNCSCIPQEENDRISRALARGDDPDTVIGPGWGQY